MRAGGLKAYLTGSISNLGTLFVSAEAVNARTGDTIARQQAEAKSKEQVLSALERGYKNTREAGRVVSFDSNTTRRFYQATTSSLEALKTFTLGVNNNLRPVPRSRFRSSRHATELDPISLMPVPRCHNVLQQQAV